MLLPSKEIYKKTIKTEINALWLSWKVYEPSFKQMRKEVQEAGFTIIDWIDKKESDTQVLIVLDGVQIYIVTRGTTFTNIRDWETNFKIRLVDHKNYHGKVHEGFYNDALSVEKELSSLIDFKTNAVVCGHSQGAAVTEQHCILHHFFGKSITAGTPRSMDRSMAIHMTHQSSYKMIHFANNNDIVHRIPLKGMGYKHVNCDLKYFDNRGRLIINPTKNRLRYTRLIGRLQSMLKFKTDGLIDHIPEAYYNLALTNK